MSIEIKNITKKISDEANRLLSPNNSRNTPVKTQRNRQNRLRYLVDNDFFQFPSTLFLSNFLDIPDNLFVEQAYHMVLRREPDPTGKKFFEDLFRSGQISRLEIIGALRYSAEGKRICTHIPGLIWLYIATKLRKKIYVAGYFLQLPFLLLSLPIILKSPRCHLLWKTKK